MSKPEGRPESKQHSWSYIAVGLAQGFSFTLFIFVLMWVGI